MGLVLPQLKRPTVLGYVYGGITSTEQQTTDSTTQTGSTNQVFPVTLTPTR
jgi:hypothetical protein